MLLDPVLRRIQVRSKPNLTVTPSVLDCILKQRANAGVFRNTARGDRERSENDRAECSDMESHEMGFLPGCSIALVQE